MWICVCVAESRFARFGIDMDRLKFRGLLRLSCAKFTHSVRSAKAAWTLACDAGSAGLCRHLSKLHQGRGENVRDAP